MKQIILVTDGCSNEGLRPEAAAARAAAEGVVVNVIGLVGEGEGEETPGVREIEEIARAGGGLSRLVTARQLARTMQMLTRQTVLHTIQQAVHRELKQLFGPVRPEALPPDQRGQVVEVTERLAETAELRIVLLVDTSASMRPKLPAVREAIEDLLLSLQARQGKSELAVFRFPDVRGGEAARLDLPWTEQLANVSPLFYNIDMNGTTPTGPALLQALRYLYAAPGGPADRPAAGFAPAGASHSKGGIWSDYVV
ncbi:hypothetical protein J31TS4_46190 [Paenibacillus sp. J31TS4]|uniref:vWA domain-containing protein n=1 Tax=Paenibacillus sp. J31TS4 TaxID=2807195 RepID=UPI001B05194C|nr:vWA domain-containing protein [Paenibacillus sp. J31TS4]GIP41339.1 hypothetical protein J31TS4_46190 [Paenibacillus sp. J31TS4]